MIGLARGTTSGKAKGLSGGAHVGKTAGARFQRQTLRRGKELFKGRKSGLKAIFSVVGIGATGALGSAIAHSGAATAATGLFGATATKNAVPLESSLSAKERERKFGRMRQIQRRLGELEEAEKSQKDVAKLEKMGVRGYKASQPVSGVGSIVKFSFSNMAFYRRDKSGIYRFMPILGPIPFIGKYFKAGREAVLSEKDKLLKERDKLRNELNKASGAAQNRTIYLKAVAEKAGIKRKDFAKEIKKPGMEKALEAYDKYGSAAAAFRYLPSALKEGLSAARNEYLEERARREARRAAAIPPVRHPVPLPLQYPVPHPVRHPMPHTRQHPVPHPVQHPMPHTRQHPMPHTRQHPMPHTRQHPVRHPVPLPLQHPMPHPVPLSSEEQSSTLTEKEGRLLKGVMDAYLAKQGAEANYAERKAEPRHFIRMWEAHYSVKAARAGYKEQFKYANSVLKYSHDPELRGTVVDFETGPKLLHKRQERPGGRFSRMVDGIRLNFIEQAHKKKKG